MKTAKCNGRECEFAVEEQSEINEQFISICHPANWVRAKFPHVATKCPATTAKHEIIRVLWFGLGNRLKIAKLCERQRTKFLHSGNKFLSKLELVCFVAQL